jgi:hypothetical protein
VPGDADLPGENYPIADHGASRQAGLRADERVFADRA